MASRQATVDELLGRLSSAGRVTARKMFGEFCVYLNDKPVALVCDDRLYVKPTAAGRELMPGLTDAPPYPGAKPHLLVPRSIREDGETMGKLLRVTFEALPPAKARKRKA